MRMINFLFALGATSCFMGCVTSSGGLTYTPPETSGLISVRPFPYDNDVCQVLGRNEKTATYFEDASVVIGCPTHEGGAIDDRVSEGAQPVATVGAWAILSYPVARTASDTVEQNPADHRYAGNTVIYYDAGHGTQVEYYDKQGTVALWYPGNQRSLPGQWKTINVGNTDAQICFRYQTNTRNPVTGVRGGSWECSADRQQNASVQEIISGDVFHLSSGAIPFVMKRKKRYTLADLNE